MLFLVEWRTTNERNQNHLSEIITQSFINYIINIAGCLCDYVCVVCAVSARTLKVSGSELVGIAAIPTLHSHQPVRPSACHLTDWFLTLKIEPQSFIVRCLYN